MNLSRFPLIFFFILSFFSVKAQDNDLLLSTTIPSSLKENVNAVVRSDYTKIEINSIKKYTFYNKRIVTVLNNEGERKIGAYIGYDDAITINKLQAVVYDAFGNEVKKFRKSNFEDVSAVSDFSLYEDSRVKYMKYTPTSYPYTVVFEQEYTTNNTAYIPTWRPLEGYYVSTQKKQLDIHYEETVGIKKLEKNFENYSIENNSEEGLVSYSASNLLAMKYEAMSPLFREHAPQLLITPIHFHYEGYIGETNNWSSLGKWMHDELLKDRVELSPETIASINQMVEGIEDPMEKAKVVYKYVQDNTRYISVQEGVGGIQPIEAKKVDEVKYGDCKGLTNYTKALLESVGVTSNYSRVYASSNNIVDVNEDFVSFLGQTNHVILNIPSKNGNVWLECTSQDSPFNYNGSFTDDRDVFVITPEGGKIVHTKAYTTEENSKETSAKIELSIDGTIRALVHVTTNGTQYSHRYGLENLLEKEQQSFYKEFWGNINNLEVSSITYNNNKDDIIFKETIEAKATNYASISGDRILLRPNVFNEEVTVPPRYKNRKLPFQISRGKVDVNEFEITFPNTIQVEALQEDVSISNKFGEYRFSIKETAPNTLLFKRMWKLKKGYYSKEDYKEYRDFLLQVVKHDKSKIVLKINK